MKMFKKPSAQVEVKTRVELVKYGHIFYITKDGKVMRDSITTDIKEAELFFDHEGGQHGESTIIKSKFL